MNAVRSERTKLLANALNTSATSCFTVGIATPIAGYLYNIGSLRSTLTIWDLAIGLLGWLSAAVALHFVARHVLKGLARE
jgi:hypothetical protein